MARPLTAEDVEAISQEAWDATMAVGNVPWAELGADAKSRYRDITIDACRFGGASGEYEVKCQELWAVRTETDPPPPEPEVELAASDEPVSVLPEGTDLTPGNLAKAIRELEGLEEEDDAAPLVAKAKKSRKPASDVWDQPRA